MEDTIATKTIKGSSQTVFIDLKKAKNEFPYVSISSLSSQNGESKRFSVRLFGTQIIDLEKSLKDLIKEQDLTNKIKELSDARPAK